MTSILPSYQIRAATTAVYPGAGTGTTSAITYLALGLGETGEVQGKVKKILRDQGGRITADNVDQIASELGDVLWYVAMLARELGVSLESIALANLQKLADRAERGVLGGSGDTR